MFDTTCLFSDCIESKEKLIIHQGGTSSGKTWAILQALYYFAVTDRNTITIVGESIPSLRKGAWRDATSIIEHSDQLKRYVKSINRTDRIIHFHNGSLMEFCSFETPRAARAGQRDILFIDECNNIEYEIYFQLAIRTTKQTFLAYNPSEKFWCHDKLIGSVNSKLIISDHRHNHFLSEEKHAEIESIPDKMLFDVYARGKTGVLLTHIYTNWLKIPAHQFPDPEMIAEIRRLGIKTAVAAKKGHGSLMAGILALRAAKVFYTSTSANLIEELKRYVFLTDRKSGEVTNKPIDRYNHLLDAIRIAYYTHKFQ